MSAWRDRAGRAIDFDPARLAARLGGGAVEILRIAGGQSNPTYFVTHDGREMVLRKPPSGEILPSAHQVDREYRVMAALADTDVPVPRMILLETDAEAIGTPFYLMERLEGRVVHDSALPDLAPADRRAAWRDAATTLARLHAVDWKAAGLEGFGREGGYFGRQIARWTKQWTLSRTREDANVETVAAWLAENVPQDDATAVVHGDYRIGNLMFAPDAPRVVGVLDWELSTLGHPLADLAHLLTAFDFTPDQLGGIAGLDRAGLGLPERAEVVADYAAAGGDPSALGPFHRAFALFRFSVIFEGITARAKAGLAASEDAERVGGLSAASAARAAEVVAGRI